MRSTTSTAIAPRAAARRSSYAARLQVCEHQIGGRPIVFLCVGSPHRGHVPSATFRSLSSRFSRSLSALMTPKAFRTDASGHQKCKRCVDVGCRVSPIDRGHGVEILIERSAYVSSVVAAEACPSIRWVAFMFAPAEIARDAAVCLRSCGVSRGTPDRHAAPANHPRVLLSRKFPAGAGKASAVGGLSLHASRRLTSSNSGNGTARCS